MLKDLQKSVADKENNDAMDNDLNTEVRINFYKLHSLLAIMN